VATMCLEEEMKQFLGPLKWETISNVRILRKKYYFRKRNFKSLGGYFIPIYKILLLDTTRGKVSYTVKFSYSMKTFFFAYGSVWV
jgi:hypothetical protein